jgi:alpha-glucoside transport system substrate-binding protein
MTRPASDRTIELIGNLAKPDAPTPWITDTGGFIAANEQTDRRLYSPALDKLADDVRQHEIRFDLSDQLGVVGGREGLQRVLQDLLQAVGNGMPVRDAAQHAVDDMVSVER